MVVRVDVKGMDSDARTDIDTKDLGIFIAWCRTEEMNVSNLYSQIKDTYIPITSLKGNENIDNTNN